MRNKLVALAAHFTSFLLENNVEVCRVIVFGSAAAGEFDRESDIDLFIEADRAKEKSIMRIKKIFEKTFAERWRLKGVENPLSILVGSLESKRWEELRRSIQSNGIVLYSKYEEPPPHGAAFTLFLIDVQKLTRSKKIKLWRKMYGYAQKVGKKVYKSSGLIHDLGGKKLEKSTVAVPAAKSKTFREFLHANKADFRMYEFWAEKGITE